MASFAHFMLCLVMFVCARSCLALFQTSSGSLRGLTAEEGTAVYNALTDLLSNSNGFDVSTRYDSGFAFANVQIINGKRVAIRYVRWTKYCTVGTWENAIGSVALEDFRTTVTYLRPYLLQGCSWASVSNGYAWVDYYLVDKKEATITTPDELELGLIPLNVSNIDEEDFASATTTFSAAGEVVSSSSSERLLMMSSSRVSRSSPVEKTGFIHCPVSPFVLLSHNNGIWDVLRAGGSITSASKRITLTMQRDCNLVLLDTQYNRVLWSSLSAGRGKKCFLRLQSDANLVIYNNDEKRAVWAINQGCGRGCQKFSSLVVQDDGNLVLLRSWNSKLNPMWATHTWV